MGVCGGEADWCLEMRQAGVCGGEAGWCVWR